MLNETCYSINAGNMSVNDGSKSVECHLMAENFYSNKSLVEDRKDWIHISLKVKLAMFLVQTFNIAGQL